MEYFSDVCARFLLSILAARLLSSPFILFFPVAGRILFLVFGFVGLWHVCPEALALGAFILFLKLLFGGAVREAERTRKLKEQEIRKVLSASC